MNACSVALQQCVGNIANEGEYGKDMSAAYLPEECREDEKVLTGMALLNGTLNEKQITQVETLCMMGSEFDDDVVEYVVSTVFPKACRLRVVEVAYTKISPLGVITLLRSLYQSPNDVLEQLLFSDTHLHSEECALIQKLMVKHTFHLQRLELQRCHMDDTAAQAVAEGIAQAKTLLEVRIAENDIIPAFAIPLEDSQWLFFPSSLKVLDVSGNRIESVHYRGLANALRRCIASLEEIYMSGCCVTESLLTTLLKVGLHSSHCLRVLNVSSGRLLHTAGKVLSSFLTECPNLERLYVQDNLIEADGAACMAIGIPCAKKLKVLGLGSCHLTGEGARVIAEAVRQTPSIRELDLSNNLLTDADVFQICACDDGSSLQLSFLDLSNNPLTERCRPFIQALLRSKKSGTCTVLVRNTNVAADFSYLQCGDLSGLS
ncbi:hypothetical protein MOQ_000385 [Trypanosoma cruzi marinkellei]|uniref:Leucine-rich repeat protein (LRRP) n=1 Tax=Trypanosoma cruzi marinkellei TaxID=85056 RepID=K2PEJ5_TRYCR|nr:hypothetical protein MOQ_000385 [Trypanosoma cruzi marinkellei]